MFLEVLVGPRRAEASQSVDQAASAYQLPVALTRPRIDRNCRDIVGNQAVEIRFGLAREKFQTGDRDDSGSNFLPPEFDGSREGQGDL